MKRVLWMVLAMTVGLALLCGAAQAWSGSGTESDPWIIATAADLVSLRDYVAAGSVTEGKYFKLTNNISLSAYCGSGMGDWTPIGSDDTGKYFLGTFDGNGHTISGLYIQNGGKHASLFIGFPAGTTVKNLTVAGYVRGGYETGGMVGWNKGVINNCHFNGTVIGTDDRTGGIAGFTGNQSGSVISNSSVEGNISGITKVGGVVGCEIDSNLENCHFSGTVTGTESVGGIVGKSLGELTGCTAAGDITGSSDFVGGIAGGSFGTIKNCTYQSGTVTGKDQVGGIVGIGNAQLIENCKSYGSVQGNKRAGGIAGETCGPIRDCENHGAVSVETSYVGGITAHNWSALGYQGIVQNCRNYGNVTAVSTYASNAYVGGIVGWSEEAIGSCENYGRIEGYQDVGGIVGDNQSMMGDTESPVTNCANYGQVIGQKRVGSIIGSGGGNTGGVVLTLKPNGAPGEDLIIVSGNAFAPECPYAHDSLDFFAWNTAADGTGTWYRVGDRIGSVTLYAIWMDWDSTVYETLDGEGEYAHPYLLDSYFMDTGVTGLPGGWYMAEMNTNVTFPGRLYLSGDVNLILAAGSTITCNGGIDVPPGSSLTIWHMQGGAGTLNATAEQFCAGIGGSQGQSNGKITINGGTVSATGNFGAGIGGGDLAAGGTVIINRGSVTAIGGDGGAGIGGGPYANGGTVTINGGSVSATGGSYSGTNQSGAGIGAGRPRPNGSQTLNGGKVTINGGTVIANAGIDTTVGANAIGANFQYSTPGSLTIARGLQALVPFVGDGPLPYAERVATCRHSLVMIQPCEEHSFRDGRCDYCDMEVAVWNLFEGNGTEGSPFLIRNTEEWNKLAALFNEDRLHNSSYTYKLINNIGVTTMIGTEDNPFTGTFDGGGKTLTFTCEDHPEIAAPFRHINGATIRNLHVDGSITGDNQRASGLIGENHGTSTVTNCRVSATISGSKLLAGFCVGTGDTLNITGCVFDGIIKRETGRASQSGCFVAWGTDGLSITDSVANLKSGTAFTGGIFCYTGGGSPTLTNCYYLTAHANVQGKQARSVTEEEGVTIDFGTPAATYSVSGITAFPAGLKYGDVFYAGEGDSLAMGLSCDVPQGYQLYMYDVSAGTLAEANGAWTLTMLNANAAISAVYVPVFGIPDFTLPAALTTVEEEAFMGAGMSAVLIPESCTSIGARAFKNCGNLDRIRIPAGCAIGTDAFDGCSLLYVYSAAGSPAETYCQEHANCVFVEE